MNARDVAVALLRLMPDSIFVSSLGTATSALRAASHDGPHFYLGGAMGSALPAAMGVADALPQASVVALVGDGELLMSTGMLWSLSAYRPRNLIVVVLANGVYGITGGQPLPLPGGFVQAAESLGVIAARRVASEEGVREALAELGRPALIEAKVDQDGWPGPSPFVDPAAVRVAFRTRVDALAERRV